MAHDLVLNKQQRLYRISHLLFRNPRGLTTRDLARLCGVDQRTIQRDILELGESGTPVWQSDERPPRYGIAKGYYLLPIRFEIAEAVALYLAGRLLARYCGHSDAYTPAALAKLANVLPEPMNQHMHATIAHLATRGEQAASARVVATLANAWASQRVVSIHYRGAHREAAREYHLHPYCLEASGEGGAIYVIGWAEPGEALRTFKIERILTATLLDRTFELPETFDGPRLLDSCWGIMYGDEREDVVLRFAASATRRLKETLWHPTQQLHDLPDGGCELRFSLANPDEMAYWVRGWGPQVEVLAPARLRQQMAEEVRALGETYGGEGGIA